MRKTLYLSLASISLIFGSCSMNKDGMNTACLQSGKLQAHQQLTVQPANQEKLATINAQVDQNSAFDLLGSPAKILPQGLHRHISPLADNNIARKGGKKIVEMANLPKTISSINRLMTMPTHKASVKNLPFEGANYLVLWIIFLVAAALFFFLATLAGATALLGILFNILGLLALLAFLLFIILWIIKLYQAHQSQEGTKH